jgi:ABC-type glycerol-3-phosphate transport system substrate-binding protein
MPGEYALCAGWNLVMLSSGKNKDAAWELMKYIGDPATQKKTILNGGDCNPTHLDVLFDAELQKKYEVLVAISEVFGRTRSWPVSTQNTNMTNIMNDYLARVGFEGMDPQQALDECAKEIRQVLIEAGELNP